MGPRATPDEVDPSLRPEQRLLRVGYVLALAALAAGMFALRELVYRHRHPQHPGDATLLFWVLGGLTVLLIMLCKLLVSLHRERADAAFLELLERERAASGRER